MIHHLTYSVTFPTGRTLSASVDFQAGLSAVTGPNEAGKSMIIEMIRYCLFGTKALRGPATDYKTLKARLRFAVNGAVYEVTRDNGKTRLTSGGVDLATGTKPVNARICELLGYDLTVFDIANACLQGQVEALGEMRPEQRKQMVDQTIGLNVLDTVIEWLGGQSNAARKSAEAVESTLVEPQEPVAPAGYPTVDRSAELQALVAEYHSLRGALAQPPIVEPRVLTEPCRETVGELQRHQQTRDAQLNEIRQLEADIRALGPDPKWTEEQRQALREQIVAATRWRAKLDHERRFPQPRYTIEALDGLEAQWGLIEKYDRAVVLSHRIEKLKAKGTHHCPACDHEWFAEIDDIERLEAELALLPHHAPPRPILTLSEIAEERRRIEIYEPNPYAEASPAEHPGVDVEADERAALAAAVKANLRAHLYEPLPDRSTDLNARRQYEWALQRYEADLAAFLADQKVRKENQLRLKTLEGVVEQQVEHTARLTRDRLYEASLETYRKHLVDYTAGRLKAQELRTQAESYNNARTAMRKLKVRIKQYLVPSLSKVASYLLSQMTGGQRNTVTVDEDFNILIDGQQINTLSGSGKAVANLAIRIGLGQVLTNKVFSVFLADEIDAAMDETRAAHTADCLRNLTQSIGQVVLVSHKRPEADHYIEL